MNYIIVCGMAMSILVVGEIIYKAMNRDNLEIMFAKIKKLIIANDICYPRINEIILNSKYNIINYTNITINKKIEELDTKIKNCSQNDNKRYYTEQKNFFAEFKIMKLIYDNFFYCDVIKPNTKILFHDSKWYEMSDNIKYLAVINNKELNLDNLDDSIKELTIFCPDKPMNNLPLTLKKLYLYNIDNLFDIKKIKIPLDCELFVESCLINKNKLI